MCAGKKMTFINQFLPFIVGSVNQTQAARLLLPVLLAMEPSYKSKKKYLKILFWAVEMGFLHKTKVQFLALT